MEGEEQAAQAAQVACGALLFPPAPLVFNKIAKKKSWQQRYCVLFNASKQGIERLEIYDNKDDVTAGAIPKIITLENCIKITYSSPNMITIFTKSQTYQMCALSETEATEWLNSLQAVAFKGADSNLLSCDEDNDLYCSSGEGVFSVKLSPSDASTRCGFDPIRYLLLLTTTAIELRDINDNKLYAMWPYKYIRRYGYRQGKFTFEAGRKCDTGEGIFHLEHPNQHEIFKCLSLKMKTMKQMIGSENMNSPEHDFNIHSSLNMIPGSRSPLGASRPDELNLSSLSSLSLKINSIASSMQSSDSAPLLRPKPALKPKPQKPPRKTANRFIGGGKEPSSATTSDDSIDFGVAYGRYKKLDNYESRELGGKNFPDNYDNIEVRNEAWRTHGLDHIDHTEFTPNLTDNGNFVKLISRSRDNLDCSGLDPSRTILLPSTNVGPNDESYDRLQLHFGSTSKLDKTYKNIEARPTTLVLNDNVKTKDTWNDYDEVENVMQRERLADDSHLGYGMIRKPNTPGPQVPTAAQAAALQNQVGLEEVDHASCNGSEYAIVSRPKRV